MQRKIIDYIIVCINEFALANGLTEHEAFNYLHMYNGINFLIENYDIEHTLSLSNAISDLGLICQKNGGALI